MSKPVDINSLMGMVFNKLTILEAKREDRGTYKKIICKCLCECGNIKWIEYQTVKNGTTKSCGCININDLTGQKFGRLKAIERFVNYRKRTTYYKCLCDCGNETMVAHSNLKRGKVVSCGCFQKEDSIRKGKLRSGENSPFWRGGAYFNGKASYDTYASQLEPIEECRRDPNNENYLQVKCSFCKGWMTPTRNQVKHRVDSLNGKQLGEQRIYCSDDCKKLCPVFNQTLYPKGYKPESNRPYIDPYWREEVLRRADYKCEICGSDDDLEAHHIQSATLNPMLANDVDNGICTCGKHHDIIHSQPGCTTYDLRCNK